MAIRMSDLRDELRETRERAELAEHQAENMARMITSIKIRLERIRSENAILREFASDVADGRWGVGSDWSDYAELYKRAIDSLVERAIALLDRIGDANKTKEGAK